MSSGQDDLIKIVLDVVGEEKVKRATEIIKQQEQAIGNLARSLDRGGISQANFDAKSMASATKIADQRKILDDNAKKTSGKVNTQGWSQLGYSIDDIQYGFRGISNNIQPVLSGFAATAAYAAPIAILAIGVHALYENWDLFASLVGKGHIKTQAEEMEELGKKAKLTADEFERLGRFNRGESGVKTLRDLRPEVEEKSDSETKKAIGEAGQRDIVEGFKKVDPKANEVQAFISVLEDKIKKEEATLEKRKSTYGDSPVMNEMSGVAASRKAIASMRRQIADQVDLSAEKVVADTFDSRDNPEARKRLADAIRKNPEAFGANGAELLKKLDAIESNKDGPMGPNLPPDLEAKRVADLADEKASEEYYDAQDRESASRYAEWENSKREAEEEKTKFGPYIDPHTLANRQAELAETKQEEDSREAENLAYNEKLAAFQEQGRQTQREALIGAKVSDAMEGRNRTSQTFEGAAGLRDSIQGSIQKDNTAVEQLKSQQATEAAVRRQVELQETIAHNTAGPARAG